MESSSRIGEKGGASMAFDRDGNPNPSKLHSGQPEQLGSAFENNMVQFLEQEGGATTKKDEGNLKDLNDNKSGLGSIWAPLTSALQSTPAVAPASQGAWSGKGGQASAMPIGSSLGEQPFQQAQSKSSISDDLRSSIGSMPNAAALQATQQQLQAQMAYGGMANYVQDPNMLNAYQLQALGYSTMAGTPYGDLQARMLGNMNAGLSGANFGNAAAMGGNAAAGNNMNAIGNGLQGNKSMGRAGGSSRGGNNFSGGMRSNNNLAQMYGNAGAGMMNPMLGGAYGQQFPLGANSMGNGAAQMNAQLGAGLTSNNMRNFVGSAADTGLMGDDDRSTMFYGDFSDPLGRSRVETPSRYARFKELSDFKTHIYEMSKDQHGCRILQKKIDEQNSEFIQVVFSEVFEHVAELMMDPFGNYLIQKLVENCTDFQRTEILRKVSSKLVAISLDMHGTRAVQKTIQSLSTDEQMALIVDALKNDVVNLIKDLNGNHVIQRCLQKMDSHDKNFIYHAIRGRCKEVATHRHGCCVLQRCLDYANDEQKYMIISEINSNALDLIQDPFGNYVVQYILELTQGQPISRGLVEFFVSKIPELSTNKFSSNVIEKCLRIADPHLKAQIIQELLNTEALPQLLQDSFGNYVIQTALTVCDQMQFHQFVARIQPFLSFIRNTPYGKKIESKINKRMAHMPSQNVHRDFMSMNWNHH